MSCSSNLECVYNVAKVWMKACGVDSPVSMGNHRSGFYLTFGLDAEGWTQKRDCADRVPVANSSR